MRSLTAGLCVLAFLALAAPASHAGGKVELYGIRMVPSDDDSRDYSRPGWGAGIQAVGPMPGSANLFAGVLGIEIVNLLTSKTEFYDDLTGLRVEQQTSQNYGRLFAGGRFGSHSGGALRPYAGLNLALVWYGIDTDVVVPDDSGRENDIRQNLRTRNEFAFGWDANAGVDVNFADRWSIDAGVRWLHAYGVPQQLGDGAVTIEPGYLQVKVGLGVGPRMIR